MFGFKHAAKPAMVCSHKRALPRWDHIEDTSNLNRVAHWYCPECDQFVAAPDREPIGGVA
jgi:hypothetical protein